MPLRFQILCDSCCDLTASERMSSVFEKVPAEVTVSGAVLRDGKSPPQPELLRALEGGPSAFQLAFPDALAYLEAVDAAAEHVYLVTSSAETFDQYAVASQARRMLLQREPGRQVHVFNTRSGSVGQLVTARRICALERSGCTYRQVVERVEAELLTTALFLLPASAEGLYRGRLTPRQYGWDKMRSLYTMSVEGRVVRAASALTWRGLEKRLLRRLAACQTSGKTCLIAHCGCPDRARSVAERLRTQASFSGILLTETGVVNSLLLGRGGLAIGF